jgi:hypothetical protein
MLYWLAKNLVSSGAKAISESRRKKQQKIADANYLKTIESVMARLASGATISEIRSQFDCSDPILNSALAAYERKIIRRPETQGASTPKQPTPHPPIRPAHPPLAPVRETPPTLPPNRPVTPPTLAVDHWDGTAFGCLHVGRKSKISFHRTLRVPEDDNDYPLPAGLGSLPIHRVEDFADTVPQKWLEEGGFFIPLYQREALFIQFEGEEWWPSIAKVCVGKVNAITGQPYSEKLSSHSQDYVVIPQQKWLDGINSGHGTVKQFVAMPLGQGYTIEAQITDEENDGGFQLLVFEPADGRFAEPAYSIHNKVGFLRKLSILNFESMLAGLNRRQRAAIDSIREGSYAAKAALLSGMLRHDVIELYRDF